MNEHPIIFSQPMVRALLDGRKTQTRRLAWRLPQMDGRGAGEAIDRGGVAKPSSWQRVKPGDRLWVREKFAPRISEQDDDTRRRYVKYAADTNARSPSDEMDWHSWPRAWRPSIHMPRWASRLTLTVTAVKIERLQDISGADAMAEGAHKLKLSPTDRLHPSHQQEAIAYFHDLWDELHGEGAWQSNPEVVALNFTVAKQNIDAGKSA